MHKEMYQKKYAITLEKVYTLISQHETTFGTVVPS